MSEPVQDCLRVGVRVYYYSVTHGLDKHRTEGVITDVLPYGEFVVEWLGIKRPEVLSRHNLKPL